MGAGYVGVEASEGKGTLGGSGGINAGGTPEANIPGADLRDNSGSVCLPVPGSAIPDAVCGDGGNPRDVQVGSGGHAVPETNVQREAVLSRGDGGLKAAAEVDQFVVNLTTGFVQKVCWNGYPSLFGGVVRVLFYSQELKRWIALVPAYSSNPGEFIEIAPWDLARLEQLQASGFTPMDAFKRVLVF
jgi:hypothetical protein